jgi:UDP-N-acetyl-D-mannosaminuronate dehydrogenase
MNIETVFIALLCVTGLFFLPLAFATLFLENKSSIIKIDINWVNVKSIN